MPTGSSHGLLAPSAHASRGGSRFAGLPRPLRSARRVWLPSRRLTPSAAWSALFHADSAREVRPSELSRSQGARASPHAQAHLPFAHPVSPAASGGPDRVSATSGLVPRHRRPAHDTAVRVSRTGNSLGLFPAKVTQRRPRSGIHRILLSRAWQTRHEAEPAGASECLSITASPQPEPRVAWASGATLIGFPHLARP